MSEADEVEVPTLGYAQGSRGSYSDVRPLALLLPNLLALVVPFLSVSGDDPPIGPILDYARHLFRPGSRSPVDIWEAFITGPFLLAIPLAIWTVRLSIQPRARRMESIAAWSMAV